MTTQQKVLFRGEVPATNTSVYSVPSSTSAIVTNLIVANTSSSSIALSISIGGFSVFSETEVFGNTSVFVDLKQVMNEFDAIEVSGSTTGLDIHVSGVEVA